MPKRVIIIGGGVIGLTTAYYCQQEGYAVTVIERQSAQRDGCSFGNAGMIVPSHFVPLASPGMLRLGLRMMWQPASPFYIKPRLSWELLAWMWRFYRASRSEQVDRAAVLLRDLHLESRELYRQLESTIPSGFGMVENGLLMLCRTQRMLDEEAHFAGRAVALSMPAEVLGPAETAAIDPAVTMDVEGSVFYPRDCHLNPERLMQQLQRALLAGGATLEWNSQVNGFRVVRDHVAAVKTSKVEAGEKVTREIETDEVVICSGVWSTALGREFRLRLPMQAGKGYSVTLSDPPERPSICSILVEARVAVTPIGRHLRFGGTMELSGLSDAISSARVRGITHAATDYFPALKPEHFAGLSPWVGLRPCSPDGLPYVGRTRRYDNVLVSTGHAMMGISLAPVSAQHIARLVTQHRPPRDCDWSLLSPDRYG